MPSSGNTVNAEVCSSRFKSAAPSVIGKYGGNGLVMPKRRAMSITLFMPIFSASFTAGTLREPSSARRSVIMPSNFSS